MEMLKIEKDKIRERYKSRTSAKVDIDDEEILMFHLQAG